MGRYFTAISIPSDIKDYIRDFISGLPFIIKETKPDNLHLTINYLGVANLEIISQLLEVYEKIDQKLFNIKICGLNYFYKSESFDILWLGIKNNPELSNLYKKILNADSDFFSVSMRRKYIPHITIGRTIEKNEKKLNLEKLIQKHKYFEVPEYNVNSFILYESLSVEGGMIYKKIKEFFF